METSIGVIMGSKSDWETMQHCTKMLTSLDIAFESQVVSAHRTPNLMYEYAKNAQERGIKVIIAGAGGAAHLPGMTAAMTNLPVIGVPIQTNYLNGQDSLYSIVQMPAGVPVATVAIGEAGAKNAAILAARILGTSNSDIDKVLTQFRAQQTKEVLNSQLEI